MLVFVASSNTGIYSNVQTFMKASCEILFEETTLRQNSLEPFPKGVHLKVADNYHGQSLQHE